MIRRLSYDTKLIASVYGQVINSYIDLIFAFRRYKYIFSVRVCVPRPPLHWLLDV